LRLKKMPESNVQRSRPSILPTGMRLGGNCAEY
jgi:hypothetical protein